MRTSTVAWGAAIAAEAVVDLVLDQRMPEATLSHVTRRVLRTHTRPGRAICVVLVVGGAAALLDHLLVT